MYKKQDVEEVKVPEFKSSKEMISRRKENEKNNKNTAGNNRHGVN